MPHNEEERPHRYVARYNELPLATRAFLETLDEEGVVELANVIRFYRDLGRRRDDSDRALAKEFLLRANHRTLEWLIGARPEEIDRLDDTVRLIGSSRTIGKFLWWVIATIVAALIVGSQIGDWSGKFLLLFKGGKP